MKKIVPILLALAVIMTLSVSAMAAEPVAAKLPLNETGVFAGIPADAEDVTYLSDLEPAGMIGVVEEKDKDLIYKDVPFKSSGGIYVYSAPSAESGHRWCIKNQDYAGNDETGYRLITDGDNSVNFYYNALHLGGLGKKFDKGISLHVTKNATAPVEVVYSAAGFDRFYAVAGGIGDSSTSLGGTTALDYEVWVSTAETYSDSIEFVKLAYVENCAKWYTGEFDLDVSDYNFVKLVAKPSEGMRTDVGTYYFAWADASFYNEKDASSGENPPSSGTTSPETADSFAGIAVALALLSTGAVAVLVTNRKKFF